MTKGQWLLVGAIALEPGRGSVHFVLLSHGMPLNCPWSGGFPSASVVIYLSIATMVLHW